MTLTSNENASAVCVCDDCQFVLHCGCRGDDHAYKLENCDYYALANRYNLMSAQFDKIIVRQIKK